MGSQGGGGLNTGQTASLHIFYNLSLKYHPTIRCYITKSKWKVSSVSHSFPCTCGEWRHRVEVHYTWRQPSFLHLLICITRGALTSELCHDWTTGSTIRNLPYFGTTFLTFSYGDKQTHQHPKLRYRLKNEGCYTFMDYQTHIKTRRDLWCLQFSTPVPYV